MRNADVCVPVKQSPSCFQHNMDVDIFKSREIMGMNSLPVPDEASLVKFSPLKLAQNKEPIGTHAMFSLLLTFMPHVSAFSLFAVCIVSLFPPQLMTMWNELRWPTLWRCRLSNLGSEGLKQTSEHLVTYCFLQFKAVLCADRYGG